MKMKIIHVLCEGQTEQGFVDEVLRPYLLKKGITSVKSVLVFQSYVNLSELPLSVVTRGCAFGLF